MTTTTTRVFPNSISANPSPQYRFMHQTRQTTGNASDQSGNGAHAAVAIALTTANAWANKGYASTNAGAGMGFFIQSNKAAFNVATDSVIFAITLNKAALGSTTVLMGNGAPAGGQGFYLSEQSDGTIRPGLTTSTASGSPTFPSLTVVCDSTDHNILFAIDGKTKACYLFVDGVLEATSQQTFSGNTAGIVNNFNIGAQGLAAASGIGTTVAFKWRNSHMLVFPNSGLPVNLSGIAEKISSYPQKCLEASDIIIPIKYVNLSIVGQSNEAGHGFFADISGYYGCPVRDPTFPHGSTLRSMWPYLATLLGKRLVSCAIWNAAIGSTSLVQSWAGMPRTWVSGIICLQGSLVLSSGGIWKVAGSGSFDGTTYTSTVQPTGTSNIPTGSDGVAWTYLGVPTATDVAGRVQQSGDTHFDPNGYLAIATSGLTNSTGFDELWALISIGQGDFVVSSTLSQYQQAMINVTNLFLGLGAKMALGMTFYDAAPGADAYYTSTLLPARLAAIASFAGNPNVIAGADLRTSVGVLPVNNQFIPALQPDTVHANDPAVAKASEFWDAAIHAGGWA